MAANCRNCDTPLNESGHTLHFFIVIPMHGDFDKGITVPANYQLCTACRERFDKARNFDKYRMMQSMVSK